MIKLICETCDKSFEVHFYRKDTAKYCLHKCYWESLKGKKLSKEVCKEMSARQMGHKSWSKGKKCPQISKALTGRKLSLEHIKNSSNGRKKPDGYETKYNGYIFVFQRNHPFCNTRKQVTRSRLVMEKMLGRYLTPEERVHHRNEIKIDDRPENLKYFPNESEHQKFHSSHPLTGKRRHEGKHFSPKTEFKKGHKFAKGGEKGWFQKGQIPWNKK